MVEKVFPRLWNSPILILPTRHLCSDDILWIDGVEKNWFIKVNICEKVIHFLCTNN